MMTQAKENEISGDIVDAAYKVHTTLGPGFLEFVYEAVLAHELMSRGHLVERQVAIGFRYDDSSCDIGFRADLVVDDLVIIELESVEHLLPVHKKQLLTYIRLANKQLGLLLNFGANRIKEGISRLVNDLSRVMDGTLLRLCAIVPDSQPAPLCRCSRKPSFLASARGVRQVPLELNHTRVRLTRLLKVALHPSPLAWKQAHGFRHDP